MISSISRKATVFTRGDDGGGFLASDLGSGHVAAIGLQSARVAVFAAFTVSARTVRTLSVSNADVKRNNASIAAAATTRHFIETCLPTLLLIALTSWIVSRHTLPEGVNPQASSKHGGARH